MKLIWLYIDECFEPNMNKDFGDHEKKFVYAISLISIELQE